jgi:Na+/H+-dicarboxylate symporter/ABC-type amino acid transport substrate-binding protein
VGDVTNAPAARPRLTLLDRIGIGLALGVFVGVLLGERAGVFRIAADGFVKLLQMAVLPYMTVSVIATIGGLSAERLRPLGVRLALVLAGVWAITFTFAFLLPLTFPPSRSAAFFSTALVERPPPLDLVGLYIPANPFFALANNIVPAIVLFSIVVGVAMMGLPRKDAVLEMLTTWADALARVMRFVTGLTPYGVFAIAASTAGTLRIEDASRLEIYLLAYAGITTLAAWWVLPALVSVLTTIPVRSIITSTREAVITATIAGDLFIVLPLLVDAAKELLAAHIDTAPEGQVIPDAIVPIAYNFPHSGKILTVSFILFAAWYSDAAVAPVEYPRLAMLSLFTFFGSMTAAIPFLLDVFRIPADTFQLYLAAGVINARLGSMVAAMHTVTVALLGSCAAMGALRWQSRAIARYLAITAVLTAAVIGGTRVMADAMLHQPETVAAVLVRMHVQNVVAAVVRTEPVEAASHALGLARLPAIAAAHTLRVGYLSDALPFAYFNGSGELVGLDVALMHDLARELEVQLEFVPVARQDLDQPEGAAALLQRGYCDIIIGGMAVTTSRARVMQLSDSYLSETLGFVVRDDQRRAFESWDAIRAHPHLKIAVPPVPYFVEATKQRLPDAEIVPITSADELFGPTAAADAIMMPAERGSAWTLRYPRFAVVVPAPDVIKVPLAFALPRSGTEWSSLIDTWIGLKRDDGTIQRLYDYWILGRNAAPASPRWSIIRDVLHWVE